MIAREPDRVASVVSFGPRTDDCRRRRFRRQAWCSREVLCVGRPGCGCLQETTPADFPPTANAAFPQAGWQIRSTVEAAPGVQRFVERLTLFLGFAGAATLLIGGVGVAGAVGHYLERKASTIAILKCLGAPGALVTGVYLAQVVAIAALGMRYRCGAGRLAASGGIAGALGDAAGAGGG